MSQITFRRFNTCLAGIAVLLLLVAGVNLIIDPYGFWSLVDEPGFNHGKPERKDNDRTYTVAELYRQRPTGLLIGTSTMWHMDTGRYGELTDSDAYNLGFANATPLEMRAYFEYALDQQPELDSVLIGADFLSFNENNPTPPTFSRALLRYHPWPTTEAAATLLSADALRASYATLRANLADSELETFRRDVARIDGRPAGRVEAFQRYLPVVMGDLDLYRGYRLSDERLADLGAIVAVCEERGIDVRLYVSPMHATHLETLYEAGLGDEYEEWLVALAEIIDYWDFSGFNSVTEERVEDEMGFYVDPLHWHSDTGLMMLSRVYGSEETGVPDDFGVFVTKDSAEERSDSLRESREAWIDTAEARAMMTLVTAGE